MEEKKGGHEHDGINSDVIEFDPKKKKKKGQAVTLEVTSPEMGGKGGFDK